MTQRSELSQDSGRKFETLGFHLPEILISQNIDSLCDFNHGVCILRGNGRQDVKGVDTNVDAVVGEANKSVVEEHVEPLLVEFLLLGKQVCLASVDKLIAPQMFLELLDNFDPELEVVGAVSVDQLTDLLALVWALSDEATVVFEQVLGEEFVEFVTWGVLVLVDLVG